MAGVGRKRNSSWAHVTGEQCTIHMSMKVKRSFIEKQYIQTLNFFSVAADTRYRPLQTSLSSCR